MPDAPTVSVAILAHEKASGNNFTLFDHTTAEIAAVTPAQAARYLAAFQIYAVGGGNSEPFNLCDAPLTRDYTVLVRGETLFETLLLNLIRYDHMRPIAWLEADDRPSWEQTTARTPVQEGTPPDGYLDYLTWQSRRVHLIFDARSGTIRECQIRQNLKLTMDARDPFKAYTQSEKKGERARQLSEARAIWRDSHALLENAQINDHRPAVFDWLAEVLAVGVGRQLGQTPQREFDVLGLLTVAGKATFILWRHDHLPLPLPYLTTVALRNRLRDGLLHAEEASRLFTAYRQRPLYRLAEELLRGGGLKGVTAVRDVKQKSVEQLAKRFDAERIYWAALEPHFRRFIVELAQRMETDGPDGGDDTLLIWSDQVETCAKETFGVALAGLEMSARTVRARALAERDFRQQLRRLLTEFRSPLSAQNPEDPDDVDEHDMTQEAGA